MTPTQTPIPPPVSGRTLHFDATLTPHRSLSPRAFALLMSAVAAVAFAGGIAFWLLGAWPVVGFCGLEAGIFYIAFRLNYRSARLSETIRLTDRELTVERIEADGRTRLWSLQPAWLAVVLDEPPGRSGRLLLRSHGQNLPVASFLSPGERVTLKAALEEALSRQRLPSALR